MCALRIAEILTLQITRMKSTPKASDVQMQRIRATGRIGPFLLVLSGLCVLTGIVGFILFNLPSSKAFLAELRNKAQKEEFPTFTAPGDFTKEFSAGTIWVSYFTDSDINDVRYQVPDSLMFDLEVDDSNGEPIIVNMEPTQRASLPSSDAGKTRSAVLIGIAELPADDDYTVKLSLPKNQANKAVAQIIHLDLPTQKETSRIITYLGIGVCGGSGAVFFGGLGFGSMWFSKRAMRLAQGIQE